ncbi:MAG TPA: methyltransferase domain-containing protein [Verrucomicrobiae bacterium]|nr:methyltransferase domain-containing protein [Verrucomicrobiae bacterium]
MKRLPFADGSIDVAVSDYTLNFAENSEEVDQTFSEIARVLSADGFFVYVCQGQPEFSLWSR